MATPASLAHTELEPPTRILVTGPMADYGVTSLPDELILGKVHYLRGQKVMLDRDLAELYGVPVKRLKEQVRRNMERFPEAFMFELTFEEDRALRSNNATLKQGEHSKYTPFVFTERGILMLANVLKSQQAIAVSIRIIDLFVCMRQALSAHKDILLRLEQLERRTGEQGSDIKSIFEYLKQLLEPPAGPRKQIGFKPGGA
ncbi:MAG TPA: ORF6N domain-containing protein [Flavobacteriales bacterium]|nr:ORF6N domain-containing protein [Flavobacteriales bacterium]